MRNPPRHRESGNPLADRLAELRVSAGLTQRELARILDATVPQLARIERGRRQLDDGLLERWLAACDAFDRLDELLPLLPGALDYDAI
jgi:transcriptional regulator with XRE-family HTH domain